MSDAVNELLDHCSVRGASAMLARIQQFHDANPEVLDFLVTELREVRDNGWTRSSVGSLWHYARWVLTQKYRSPGESFVMDQNFSSYYARIIAILHPDLNGFFEMKESKRADSDLGTRLEPATKKRRYIRRLLWADGKAIEDGWRPNAAHDPKPVSRRERISRKPPTSVRAVPPMKGTLI